MSGAICNHRVRTYQAPDTAPSSTNCTAFLIPDDPTIRAAIWDVLAYLCLEGVWTPSDNVSEIDMMALMSAMLDSVGSGC